MQQEHLALSRISRCLQLTPHSLIRAYGERYWMRHIKRVHRNKPDGANRKRIVGSFRHRLPKACEALFVNIVVANDLARRREGGGGNA